MRLAFLFSRMAACGFVAAVAMTVPSLAEDTDAVKIGLLASLSGPLAAGGDQIKQGVELCLDEHNFVLAGRKVELHVGDTAGQPAQARTKTQELVERADVDVLFGPVAAFEALAIDDYIRQAEIPILSNGGAEDLTQRRANPWFIRAVGTSAQPNHPLGDYAAKTLGYKRIITIADDFAFGHEVVGGFQRTFEDAGGTVVAKLWPPLNTADYGTYIAQIPSDVDAVYIGFAGGNGLKFLQQFNEYGLKGTVPVLATMTAVDEAILKNMGDEALDVISSGWYSAAYDNAENKAFVAASRAKFGVNPGYHSVGSYTACMLLEQALKATEGKTDDAEKLRAALRSASLSASPRGAIKLDEYGNPIQDVLIRKVEKDADGRLVNAVIQTYPAVSQFWTYPPAEFLANPVYSRGYPPLKAAGN
jgi:branched-chain amino acid transport system substrate-binding protein